MRIIFRDKRVKDFSEILLSKLVIVLLSFVTGFLIPAALSIEDYAYYSLFALYISYLGIFHFGFVDGLYLKYGKLDLDDLPHEEYRYFSKFLILKQILLAIITVLVVRSIFSFDSKTTFIMSFAAINMVAVNLQVFFMVTSQGTRNVRYTAVTSVLQKIIITLFALSTLLITVNIVVIVLVLTLSNYIVFFIGLFHYRDLIFGKSCKGSLKDIYKTGIPLLIANYIGIFIMTMDKLFISNYYSIDSLSYYSFALSMLVIINAVINSLYQVLYPNISRLSKDNKVKFYQHLSIILIIVTVFGLSGYFVLELLIPIILPKYDESLKFLAIILPTLIFKVDADVAKKSYLYTDKLQNESIIINTFILVFGLSLNFYFVYIGMEDIYIAYATLLSFAIWSILLEIFFAFKGYSFNIQKYFYIGFCLLIYLILNNIEINSILKIVVYIISIGIITLLMQRKILRNITSMFRN